MSAKDHGAVGRAISQAPAGILSVHRAPAPAGSTKNLVVAKFRDPVPALEQPSSSLRLEARKLKGAPAKGRAGAARRQDHLPHWQLTTPQRAYEGFKEMVGSSSTDSSCYVLVRVGEVDEGGAPGAAKKKKKVLSVEEVDGWVGFKPAILYQTLSIEDAEMAMDKRDVRGSEAMAKARKMLHPGGGADDDEAGGAQGSKLGGFDEMGGGDDDFGGDDFEDEEGGAFEDGREGLDVEADDLFDDDEDDEANEDDAAVVGDRELGKKQIDAEVSRVRLGEGEEELGADGEEGGKERSEWLGQFKEALKEERKKRRSENPWEEGEEEEGDDDDDDEVMARLRHLSDEADAESVSSGAGSEAAAPAGTRKRKPAAAAAEGKRPRTEAVPVAAPGAGARSTPSPQPPAAGMTAAAARGAGVGLKVREKDVVLLLHRSGRITLKELIDHFKGYLKSKEDKSAFRELVSAVSKLEKDGDTRYAILKDALAYKYDLK